MPTKTNPAPDVRMDFTVGVAMLSASLSVMLPAIFSSLANAFEALKEDGRVISCLSTNEMTRLLVMTEVALTCALLG